MASKQDGDKAVTDLVDGFLDDEGGGDEQQPTEQPTDDKATPPAPEPEEGDDKDKPTSPPKPEGDPDPPTDADDQPIIPADVLGGAADVPEAGSDDEPEPPEIRDDPKANHAWQTLKAEKKQLGARVKELEAQVAATSAADPEEVKALREQVASLEGKVGQYDLAETAEFKQRYEVPFKQSLRKGASLLQRAGKSEEEAEALMARLADPRTSLEQIQEMVIDEPVAIQGALINLATDMSDISSQRAQALEDWKETKAALQIQEQRDNEVRLAEDIEAASTKALEQVLSEGNFMYSQSSNEDWNAQVAERVNAAKGIIKSATPEELVKWVMEGVTAKPLRDMLAQAHALAESRKAELEGVVSKSPKLKSGDGKPPKPPKSKEPRSPEQVFDELSGDEPGVL